MASSIITYEALYDIYRKEKYAQELQQLPATFFIDVVRYIEEKTSILENQKNKDPTFAGESKKTEAQLNAVKKILEEIYERRENKILQLAMLSSRVSSKQDLGTLLKEELELYDKVFKLLDTHRNGILRNILSAKMPNLPEEAPKPLKTDIAVPSQNTAIRFMQDVPRFVDADLITYGPFEKEDVANIPGKLAAILIRNNKAEEIR
ncbi:MAG TPA: hypothetical protein VJC07_03175 [Candidatus Nanoarchaeia archaeon]|nr:hypothetical protein [Candidatus Nanoarchaeia archaeon]